MGRRDKPRDLEQFPNALLFFFLLHSHGLLNQLPELFAQYRKYLNDLRIHSMTQFIKTQEMPHLPELSVDVQTTLVCAMGLQWGRETGVFCHLSLAVTSTTAERPCWPSGL